MKKKLLLLLLFFASFMAIKAENVMTLVTKNDVGKSFYLKLDAHSYNKSSIWVDLNNNQIKDKGESVTKFGRYQMFVLGSHKFTVRGSVTKFACPNNKLTSLDVSRNHALKSLYCYNNLLTSLNIANGNSSFFTSFDSRDNPLLKCIRVDYGFQPTRLFTKDVRANYNYSACPPFVAVKGISFKNKCFDLAHNSTQKLELTFSPELPTIKDIEWFISNKSILRISDAGEVTALKYGKADIIATSIDGKYVDTCHITVVKPKEILFQTGIRYYNDIYLSIDAAPKDRNNVWIDLNNDGFKDYNEIVSQFGPDITNRYTVMSPIITIYGNVTLLDCSSSKITSLDLSKNTSLETLSCNSNLLMSLDISHNTSLRSLYCSSNYLYSLDVSKNTSLRNLYCFSNQLSSLDLSKNSGLANIRCYSNLLKELDLSKNVLLETLDCHENKLVSLKLSAPNLYSVDCNMNQLSTLDLSKSKDLGILTCNDNSLKLLDLTNCTGLTTLYCQKNRLTLLNINKSVELLELKCFSNQLKSLDVTNSPVLTSLYCGSNFISTLNVIRNTQLKTFHCSNNEITSLDLSNNRALSLLNCSSNKLTSLDVSANKLLIDLACSSNHLTSLNVANGNNRRMHFFARYNKVLTCIQVDPYFVPDYNWKKDAMANWSNTACFEFIPVESISFNYDTLNVAWEHSKQLVATLTPKNVTLDSVTWITTNNRVVSVDNHGLVKSKFFGEADIIATSFDGDFADTCHIKVVEPQKITITTTKQPGEKLSLLIDADIEEQPYIWIDLNNNSVKDFNEDILSFDIFTKHKYTVKSQTISIHGNINYLNCSSNNLTSLKVEYNEDLHVLNCSDNQLDILDVTDVNTLNHLNCASNSLKNLNLSKNADLNYLSCSLNKLQILNVANGNDVALSYFKALSNPLLYCIQIDNNFTPTYDWKKSPVANWSTTFCMPYVAVEGISLNKDTCDIAWSCSRQLVASFLPNSASIDSVTWTIGNEDIAKVDNIGSVTGIALGETDIVVSSYDGAFKDTCHINIVEPHQMVLKSKKSIYQSITLGLNALLEDQPDIWIDLNNNKVKEANEIVSQFDDNTTIDYKLGAGIVTIYGNVSNMNCASNILYAIDVKDNSSLDSLNCSYNMLSSLDVSANMALTYLDCSNNKLKDMNITANSSLSSLICSYNVLTSIDASANTKLSSLDCSNNKLTALDMSANAKLSSLDCSYNSIKDMNVANTTNASFTLCDATANQKLVCIQVDADFTPSSNWKKDAMANWSSSACPPYVAVDGLTLDTEYITLVPFASQQISPALSPESCTFDSVIWTSNNKSIATIDKIGRVTARAVGDAIITATSFDGDFKAICHISVVKSQKIALSTKKFIGDVISLNVDVPEEYQSEAWIDLNNNSILDLNERIVTFNALTNYTLASQTVCLYAHISSLVCKDNSISSLDVSNSKDLVTLDCSSNNLDTIDISTNLSLTQVDVSSNVLRHLDVSSNLALTSLHCSSNILSSLNLTKNLELEEIYCASNKLSKLHVSNNSSLVSLNCRSNQLTHLDISSNASLVSLICSSNKLNVLDLNSNISMLDCSFNQLTALDLNHLSSLLFLDCQSNQLITLNIANGMNTHFNHNSYDKSIDYAFNAFNNPSLVCILLDTDFDPTVYDVTDKKWLKDTSAQWSDKPCGDGINDLHSSFVEVWSSVNKIHIDHVTVGQEYLLMDISGRIIQREVAEATHFEIVLPQGFYVIKIDNHTFKVIVNN